MSGPGGARWFELAHLRIRPTARMRSAIALNYIDAAEAAAELSSAMEALRGKLEGSFGLTRRGDDDEGPF